MLIFQKEEAKFNFSHVEIPIIWVSWLPYYVLKSPAKEDAR